MRELSHPPLGLHAQEKVIQMRQIRVHLGGTLGQGETGGPLRPRKVEGV